VSSTRGFIWVQPTRRIARVEAIEWVVPEFHVSNPVSDPCP
jgi:hypothetical protein